MAKGQGYGQVSSKRLTHDDQRWPSDDKDDEECPGLVAIYGFELALPCGDESERDATYFLHPTRSAYTWTCS